MYLPDIQKNKQIQKENVQKKLKRERARETETPLRKFLRKRKKRGGGGPKRNLNLVINFNTSKHLKYNHVVRIQQTSKQMSRTPT